MSIKKNKKKKEKKKADGECTRQILRLKSWHKEKDTTYLMVDCVWVYHVFLKMTVRALTHRQNN